MPSKNLKCFSMRGTSFVTRVNTLLPDFDTNFALGRPVFRCAYS